MNHQVTSASSWGPLCFVKVLTFWTVFVFPCHLSVRSAVFDWNAPFPHFLVFSALPFCLVFHSLLSSGQRYCLKETGCIARVHVCVLVFKCVHKGTTGCISKVMVTNPYLFFFLPLFPAVCVSSAILEKCVWIHLCGGLLRCDAPYHRFLYIAYICLNNKNRFMKPASAV